MRTYGKKIYDNEEREDDRLVKKETTFCFSGSKVSEFIENHPLFLPDDPLFTEHISLLSVDVLKKSLD